MHQTSRPAECQPPLIARGASSRGSLQGANEGLWQPPPRPSSCSIMSHQEQTPSSLIGEAISKPNHRSLSRRLLRASLAKLGLRCVSSAPQSSSGGSSRTPSVLDRLISCNRPPETPVENIMPAMMSSQASRHHKQQDDYVNQHDRKSSLITARLGGVDFETCKPKPAANKRIIEDIDPHGKAPTNHTSIIDVTSGKSVNINETTHSLNPKQQHHSVHSSSFRLTSSARLEDHKHLQASSFKHNSPIRRNPLISYTSQAPFVRQPTQSQSQSQPETAQAQAQHPHTTNSKLTAYLEEFWATKCDNNNKKTYNRKIDNQNNETDINCDDELCNLDDFDIDIDIDIEQPKAIWLQFVRVSSDDDNNLATFDCHDMNFDDTKVNDHDNINGKLDNNNNNNPNKRSTFYNDLRTQQDAIWELITTEYFYLKRLKIVESLFLDSLKYLQDNYSLLVEIDAQNLASNIGQIYEANKSFWMSYIQPTIEKSRLSRKPLDPSNLRNGFVQIRYIFSPYYRYCLEHRACLQYLKRNLKSSNLFRCYIEWCESKKSCDRLRLADLLAKPTQRLTRYSLLLKAIAKRTHNQDQLSALNQMLGHVNRFVLTVDLELRRKQDYDRLVYVSSLIESCDFGLDDVYSSEITKLIKTHYLCQSNTNSSPKTTTAPSSAGRRQLARLLEPIFKCPFNCRRQIIFDSLIGTTSLMNLHQKPMNRIGQPSQHQRQASQLLRSPQLSFVSSSHLVESTTNLASLSSSTSSIALAAAASANSNQPDQQEFASSTATAPTTTGNSKWLSSDATAGQQVKFSNIKFRDSQTRGAKMDIVVLILTDQMLICKLVSSTTRRALLPTTATQNKKLYQQQHQQAELSRLPASPRLLRPSAKSGRPVVDFDDATSMAAPPSPSSSKLTSRALSLIMSPSGQQRGDEALRLERPLVASMSQDAHGHPEADARTAMSSTTSLLSSQCIDSAYINNYLNSNFLAGQANDGPKLRLIRAPYPIDKLEVHELRDSKSLFCCLVEPSSRYLTNSFVLYLNPEPNELTSTVSSSYDILSQLGNQGHDHNQGQHNNQHQQDHPARFSPASQLIELIREAQLKLKLIADFHSAPLVFPAWTFVSGGARQTNQSLDEAADATTNLTDSLTEPPNGTSTAQQNSLRWSLSSGLANWSASFRASKRRLQSRQPSHQRSSALKDTADNSHQNHNLLTSQSLESGGHAHLEPPNELVPLHKWLTSKALKNLLDLYRTMLVAHGQQDRLMHFDEHCIMQLLTCNQSESSEHHQTARHLKGQLTATTTTTTTNSSQDNNNNHNIRLMDSCNQSHLMACCKCMHWLDSNHSHSPVRCQLDVDEPLNNNQDSGARSAIARRRAERTRYGLSMPSSELAVATQLHQPQTKPFQHNQDRLPVSTNQDKKVLSSSTSSLVDLMESTSCAIMPNGKPSGSACKRTQSHSQQRRRFDLIALRRQNVVLMSSASRVSSHGDDATAVATPTDSSESLEARGFRLRELVGTRSASSDRLDRQELQPQQQAAASGHLPVVIKVDQVGRTTPNNGDSDIKTTGNELKIESTEMF